MRRRTLLAACGGALGAGLAGCLGDDSPSENPTDTTTPTATPGSTETPPNYDGGTDDADPDFAIYLENDSDEQRTVSLTVSRESGEVVFEESFDADPGSDREVYNLKQADPDGIEGFDITATMDDQEESMSVRTSQCYGDGIVGIDDEGTLFTTYAIC